MSPSSSIPPGTSLRGLEVTGDLAIARGVASTYNHVMRCAQAAVLLEGSADAGRETQDLRVFVVPEINLGAASLAYAVINPVVGLSTFVAQLFLREPLAQANTREFRIHGSWAHPAAVRGQPRVGQALALLGAPRFVGRAGRELSHRVNTCGQALPRVPASTAPGASAPSAADEVAR